MYVNDNALSPKLNKYVRIVNSNKKVLTYLCNMI